MISVDTGNAIWLKASKFSLLPRTKQQLEHLDLMAEEEEEERGKTLKHVGWITVVSTTDADVEVLHVFLSMF